MRWLSLLALLLPAKAALATALAFALIGDVPYNRFERTWFADYLRQVTADEVDFVIHAGDIKSGGEYCSDEVFDDRFALFDASPIPFVLTPGDNDWSDCNRLAAGRFDPLERLDALRRRFYPPGESLGQRRLAVTSQADAMPGSPFRENLLWQAGPATFVTLNVVGPSNRRGRAETPPAEFARRNAANLAWLAHGLARARADGSTALVVTMQANPWLEAFDDGDPHPGFGAIVAALRDAAETFDGQVLLLHGDHHVLTIDQPLSDRGGRPLANFTRVQCYGSPLMGWVRIVIDPAAGEPVTIVPNAYSPTPPGRVMP
ncbi:MAG: metallophosphoesterase [Rhodocyclaceae bacterium]|nr:metallophosphoesterase [Rhodocyclaceae bacterium]